MESDTTSISFQPLSGAMSSTPFAYLLHIDEFTILLDCGWTPNFRLEEIQPLIDCCSNVNAVLLSHATIEHIGALPYLCAHGLSAPIFATTPIFSLGSLLLYDYYVNKLDEDEFTLFNASDIENAFNSITRMSYEQPEELDVKKISITPYNAGYTLGGTAWRIVKGQNEIIYSVSVGDNSLYLAGFSPAQTWHPTLWILDARGPEDLGIPDKSKIANALRQRLNQEKIVMFPTDGVSGALEVLMLLVDIWKTFGYNYPIYFLTHSSTAVIKNAQSLSTYLSKAMIEKVNNDTISPFDFTEFNAKQPIMHIITDMRKLPPLMQTGYVLVTSDETIDHGFSKKLFLDLCRFENLIFMTQREPENSIGHMIMVDNTHRVLNIVRREREPLKGKEYLDYKQMMAEQANEEDSDIWDSEDDQIEDEGSDSETTEAVSALPVSALGRDRFQFKAPKRGTLSDFGRIAELERYAHGIAPKVQMDKASVLPLNVSEKSFLKEPEFEPSKIVEVVEPVPFNAAVTYASFERLSKLSTVAFNVTPFAPADIIIVGAEAGPTNRLREIIASKLPNTQIQTPSVGAKVFLQRDFSTRKISLSRALLSGLDFKQCGTNDVAYIDAALKADEHTSLVNALPVEFGSGHTATFVGRIEMSALSEKLTALGIHNEFKEDGMECGARRVKVRLVGENGVVIEGMICADYIMIRNAIQELFTMV